MHITDTELCTILCALGEAAAHTEELAQLLPDGEPQRQVLEANAAVYQGLATRLTQRAAVHSDARYPTEAARAHEQGLSTAYRLANGVAV